jgi:ankyrin repeat protein
MKKLFTAIRKHDNDTVKELLAKNPKLIHCTAKQPPKKDDGQSPLQVAFKCENFEIAEHLLDLGADVNFIESESCNEWKMPVIQDAIMAAVMHSRWNTKSFGGTTYETRNSSEQADTAFNLLKRMFECSAKVDVFDSYGNSCLMRAILDARQILPQYLHQEGRLSDDRIVTDELKSDLSRIFTLLFELGADSGEIHIYSGKTIREYYAKEPVAEFLI